MKENKESFELELIDADEDFNERRIYDSLSGLFNRDGFFQTVRKRIQDTPKQECVMICFNVRNFKMINNLFGIKKGDEIIKSIGDILKKRDKFGDISARFHSDNFSIFMTKQSWLDNPLEDTVTEIENLINTSNYHLDLVVGVYMVKRGNHSIFDMNDKARLAMKIKRSSSNSQFHFYSDNMMNKVRHQEEVIAEFDDALKNDEFILFLQPQFDGEGNFVGTEALARWDRKHTGEILPPSRFIEILEETKRIHRLDQQIWEIAAKQIKKWENTKFKDVSISVNISPEDFECINTQAFFKDLIERYQIDPKKLHLELTETAIIYSPVKFENFVNEMHDTGFILELDDFGSGYSSLNVLKNLNVDTIKLDMVFVRGLNNDERAQVIMGSVIEMIKKLGMDIIVEGVETRGQLETIKKMGDVHYQGYYFSKPLPVSLFEEKYGDRL